MRKNVLISTTRQWNPGDEFIMQGSVHVLENAFGNCINPIIFNRNPDIRGGSKWRNGSRNAEWSYEWDRKDFRGKGILSELFRLGHWDNSFKDDMDSSCIDLALFAGSPEWFGNRLISMYKVIEQADIPTVFFGLGAGDKSSFSSAVPSVNRVLSKSRLILCRDHATEALLSSYGAKYMPCPAFLAAKTNRQVTDVKKIGLIYATNYTLCGNNVSAEMHAYIVRLYSYLSKKYNVGLVCHYIDEIEQARKELPGIDIYYSYDSKDYADIYNEFDIVIGGRVHGIGMSASLGIPGIMIKHDSRSNTTDGFLADSIQINTMFEEVENVIQRNLNNISNRSLELIKHKESVMIQYVEMLKKAINYE